MSEIVKQALKVAEKAGFNLIRASDLKPFTYLKCGIEPIDALGGPVLGRYIVRYGNPGSGKSSLSARYMAWAQKAWPDRLPLLVDAELKAVPAWYAAQGVDTANLLMLQNIGTMEDYFDAIIALVKSGVVSYCVIDSISAMTPRDVLETSAGVAKSVADSQIASDAKKIQQWIKMSKEDFFKSDTACEIIAQVRTHGIGGISTYESFSGGHMMRHMAVQIWQGARCAKSEWEFEDVNMDGNKVKVVKSFGTRWTLEKDTGPNETKRAFAKFVVGTGFDDFECHIRAALRLGTVEETSTGRYKVITSDGEEKKLHGFDKLADFYRDKREFDTIKQRNLEAAYSSDKQKEEEGQ